MYFQLEVDYCSNEANKNKYTNFQLITSSKKILKISEDQIVQGILLATTICHTLLLGLESICCLDLLLLDSIFFKCQLGLSEQGISRSIFISKGYT